MVRALEHYHGAQQVLKQWQMKNPRKELKDYPEAEAKDLMCAYYKVRLMEELLNSVFKE